VKGVFIMVYRHVYFRIESGYVWSKGHTPEQSEAFHKEIDEIFLSDGWEIQKSKGSAGCETAVKGKEQLYLHPMDLSGVVLEENIPHIESLLSDRETFKHRMTDVYEQVFDISKDEYLQMLKDKEEYIKQDILTACTTPRRNLFITQVHSIINKVLNKYRIKRIDHYIGVYSSGDSDYQYVLNVWERLLEDKKIITGETKNGKGYRTATKKDMQIA
jgi:hypothetical protein